jgi:hypothetical protein
MTDGEAIQQLVSLYTLAIDAKQWHVFERVFATDAEIDYPGGAHWDGMASFRDDFEVAHRIFDVTQHLITNLVWSVSGDTGSALSQCHFHLIRRGVPGGDMVTGGAWYDDDLRRTDDGWRIARRVCRVSWLEGNAGVIEGFNSGRGYDLMAMSQGVENGNLTFLSKSGLALATS